MNEQLLKLEPTVQMMLRQQCKDEAPNGVLAYVLLIFLGWCGIHMYYLASRSKGSLRTTLVFVGLLYTCTFALAGSMWFFDLLFLPLYLGIIKKENEEKIVNEYLVANGLKEVVNEESDKGIAKYDAWGKNG